MDGDRLLLIRHQNFSDGSSYWLLPGGGMEEGETAEGCLARELKEETNLDVRVVKIIMEDGKTDFPGVTYQNRLTYLCRPLSNEARPGYEPESEAASRYRIAEVRWVNLKIKNEWYPLVKNDPWALPTLQRICSLLGYPV